MLPHIKPDNLPGVALVNELFLEGGVRGVEVGSLMFAHPDPETGKIIHPKLQLVRLAVPRRVYTQVSLDVVLFLKYNSAFSEVCGVLVCGV